MKPSDKIFYNKLVRDKIPGKIELAGSKYEARELSEEEFENELFKKLVEEAKELISSKKKEQLISELADLQDVLDEIMEVKKISKEEIRERQEANFKKKGGFKKRIFLVWSSDDGYEASKKKEKTE